MTDAIVYVVDDDASMRRSLERLLRAAGYLVVSFTSPRDLLKARPDHHPGCILLDVQMPDLNGLELQQELAARNVRTPIIFLTGHGDIPMSVQAIKRGAVDFLTKPFDEQALLATIAEALQKDSQWQRELQEKTAIEQRYRRLTPREQEVLALVIKGLMNKEIAAELGASEKTVKVHRGRVMQKMQLRSVAELVRAMEKLPPDTTKVL